MFSQITAFFQDLRTDPAGAVVTLLYTAVCILLSLILHEIAHGCMALKCGDPTAKWMGRLTLDPRKHLDPLGTICMVFLRVGWARPVPVNPRNFRKYRRDMILVSLAGIIMNLLLFFCAMFLAALISKVLWQPALIRSVEAQGEKKALLDLYHYLPANAVYGGSVSAVSSWLREEYTWVMYIQRFLLMMAQMNLGLAVFNLIPVPPLDGYRFLDEFVFHGRLNMNPQTMQMIHIIFLVVCMSGLLSGFLSAVNGAVFSAVSAVFALII